MSDVTGATSGDPDQGIKIATSAINFPTIFSDGAWFAYYTGGVVRITFLENILEPKDSVSPGVKARHVGTLAMPIRAYDSMLKYLNERQAIFKDIEARERTDVAE